MTYHLVKYQKVHTSSYIIMVQKCSYMFILYNINMLPSPRKRRIFLVNSDSDSTMHSTCGTSGGVIRSAWSPGGEGFRHHQPGHSRILWLQEYHESRTARRSSHTTYRIHPKRNGRYIFTWYAHDMLDILYNFLVIPQPFGKISLSSPSPMGTNLANQRIWKMHALGAKGCEGAPVRPISTKIFFNIIDTIWLVVSTHLKNISENGNLPQIGMKIKNIWNHHLGMRRMMRMMICNSFSY